MTEDIKKLTDYQHIRLRPGMYIGSMDPHTQDVLSFDENYNFKIEETTWVPAIYTTFREILDNALDEVVGHGFGNRIDIDYDLDSLTFAVTDNGRGIPIDFDEEHGKHKATMALTEPRTGRNFAERKNVAGTNGIGSSAVAISSEEFLIEIHRDGKKFTQRITEGLPGATELDIDNPKIIEVKSGKTGTKVKFTLSKALFKHRELPDEFIRSKIYEIAAIQQAVTFYINGQKVKTNKTIEKTLFAKDKVISIDIKDGTFNSKFIIRPNATTGDAHYTSIVNNIPAFNGGSHVDAFRRGFIAGILTALERESKRRKLTPNRADVSEGILVFNVTQMDAPNFDSQSKTRLINEEAGKAVQKFLTNDEVYKDIIKKHKEWIDEIYERCAERTHKKDADDLNKESKKLSRKKLPKLLDATDKDRTNCILILSEGDSAIAKFSAARNPKVHAGLPLRGKVLNVNGEAPKRILESQALIDIMIAIGLQVNEKADRSKLRYGKIYIAHDADQDGYNIGALLVNFLYTYWPELFDADLDPFVNVFMTPLLIAKSKKDKSLKYWYAFDAHEFSQDDYPKNDWKITRAKGLGRLEDDDWKFALDNPTLFPLVDDGKLKESLDLIFNGERSDDRKDWMGI